MKSVGTLLRDCRRDAKPSKIAQKQIADILQKDISYISKVEKGEIEPTISGTETEKLAQLFRENKVADVKIQEFIQACESARITGGVTSDKDSDILKIIYTTLQELDESEKQAYRKELRDRNDVWHGLNQIMRKFRDNKVTFGEAEEAFQRLDKIEENSVSSLRARLQLESSRIFRYQGKIRSATTNFSHALELAKKAGDDILLADALKERGDFYRRSKQEILNSALEDYEKVYEIYENRYNEAGKANAQIRIASILLTSGLLKYNNHDAIKLCEESLKYAQIRRDDYLERKSLEYKAWALSMKGFLDQSLELQHTAHEIAVKSNGEPKELAKSATYMAGFYLSCGLLDEAEKWFNEADNHVKQMFSGRGESDEEKEIFIRALIYLGLGTVKTQRLSERIEARSFLERSLEYAYQSNDSLTLGKVFRQLGQLDMIEGALPIAREKFEAAKSSFEKSGLNNFGNPYQLSSLYFSLIELEYRSKNYARATSILKEIEALASRFEYHEYLIRQRLWNALLLAITNLKANGNKIIDLCFSAINEAIATDPYILRNSLNTITSDIEKLYKEGQQVEIISIAKKMIKQAPERLSLERNPQAKLLENWVENLRSSVSGWDVLSQTLKPKTK
jgi:tetratricopeptide (TPR) repeat protein